MAKKTTKYLMKTIGQFAIRRTPTASIDFIGVFSGGCRILEFLLFINGRANITFAVALIFLSFSARTQPLALPKVNHTRA
jgi:hypothetical protein